MGMRIGPKKMTRVRRLFGSELVGVFYEEQEDSSRSGRYV